MASIDGPHDRDPDPGDTRDLTGTSDLQTGNGFGNGIEDCPIVDALSEYVEVAHGV
jgi:hypothetical protein